MILPDWFPVALAVALLTVTLVLGAQLWSTRRRLSGLEQRLATFLADVSSKDFAGSLDEHLTRLAGALQDIECLAKAQEGTAQKLRKTLGHVSLVRYSAFGDTGGDQSFSMALVDDEGRGVVVTSLHSRDSSRVYGKPLLAWDSAHQLSEEEVEAISMVRSDA